jgi:pilus assembly protein Flp/PilA
LNFSALGDDLFGRVFCNQEVRAVSISKLHKFAQEETGATSIEYALIAGIVSVAIVAGLLGIKTSLLSKFSSVAAGIEEAKH